MRKKSIGSLNDQPKMSRQAYQRGAQRDGSPHYVFLYSDDEDEGSQENIPMEPKSVGKVAPRKVEVIKVALKPEDSLQSLALRYRCTISELKRINNIHKENEIFAHRYIKVPVQPYSILTETLIDYAEEQQSPAAISSHEQVNGLPTGQLAEPIRDEELMNLGSTAIPTASTSRQNVIGINDIILNSVCEPLNKSVACDPSESFDGRTRDTETERLLACEDNLDERSSATQIPTTIDTFKCSGADWGLSWIHLFGVSLLLVFAGPLIYIIYIAEESPP